MWFTFFYGAIIPIGIPLSMTGIMLYYLVDKFNVLRRRTIKEKLSGKLSDRMTGLLELILAFNGVGNYICRLKILNQQSYLDIVIALYGIIYAFLPWNEIVNWMFKL